MALLSRRISHTTRPRDLRLYLASEANASIKSQVSTFSNRSKDTNPTDGIRIFSNGWDKQCRMSGCRVKNGTTTYELYDINIMFADIAEVIISEIK